VSLQISDSIAPATRRRIQHFEPCVVANGMKRFLLLACFLALAACASGGYDDDDAGMPQRRPMSDDTMPAQNAGGLMLPPSDWWRQAEIADRVKPTADQVAALDKLQTEQGDELTKLQRDMTVAERDLRTVLESEKPESDAIMAAGQRVRTMRDEIFGRQLRLLAAERAILTREQWSALEDAIRMSRRDRMRNGAGGRGPGGRGAYPGRGGRRPGGFPGW
jgi:hypothetical protein